MVVGIPYTFIVSSFFRDLVWVPRACTFVACFLRLQAHPIDFRHGFTMNLVASYGLVNLHANLLSSLFRVVPKTYGIDIEETFGRFEKVLPRRTSTKFHHWVFTGAGGAVRLRPSNRLNDSEYQMA